MHLCITFEQTKNYFRGLIQILIAVHLVYFFDNNDIFLIYCRNKIPVLALKDTAYLLKLISLFVTVGLYNIYHSAHISFNMQFFGTIVNIYQKQVIQQQVLDKIVFIKSFLICNQQILNLETCDLSNHVNIITVAVCQQYIL